MKLEELKEEIAIELENIEKIVQEILALRADLGAREPTVREKTAAAAFLAQFYSGIENILKRISHFYGIPLPIGDTWHIDLFKRFCQPAHEPLPALFDEALESTLAPFRKFRHVFYHDYGFHFDWDRMQGGIATVDDVFTRFKSRLHDFMQALESS
jgi:hypothetical protein